LVEEVFVRYGRVLRLEVGGQAISTTAEHPFWVRGKGWLPAGEMMVGDQLLGHDGRWSVLTGKEDTGEYRTVYNLRVAECHTYFVGSQEWGFSVWAHNTYRDGMTPESAERQLRDAGIPEGTARALARAGALDNVNGNQLIARAARAAQFISLERWENLAGRNGERLPLSRTEGQELLDTIHGALRSED
jgi:hypothetical protein